MRVTCEGWRHIDKYHKLMDRDISGVELSSKRGYSRDEIHIELNDGVLSIATGVENLKINGNFAVEIRLSKKGDH